VVPPGDKLLCDARQLENSIQKYKDRKLKIGSFSACSNVTGIETPYHQMAAVMHKYGGVCFVDFAASAPYSDINMHPENPEERLDAIFFSPHKFLGGPGTSGVLVFHKSLYKNRVPDHPGGGTVNWTNPWGGRSYIADIEVREDGGTPGFLQAIRTALCIQLKEQMGTNKMRTREHEMLDIIFDVLPKIQGLHILAAEHTKRLGVISFYIENVHHNLIVRLLSDRFGIQVRGGCSCAGTYGHYLLNVDIEQSQSITEMIDQGDLSLKPGWVRVSIHPLMTDADVHIIVDAIRQIALNCQTWKDDYDYCPNSNEFRCKRKTIPVETVVEKLFEY
jgi:selenocysteine lyase/cysteine desulfurase